MKNIYDIDAFEMLIRNRRSVYPKDFTGQLIDDSTVEKLLENCLWAPNHGKTEPWRFKVFKGEALKGLGAFLAETYKEITPDEKFKPQKYESLKTKPSKASHVIGICMKRQASENLPLWDELMAVACAVQNLYLSVTAYGLAGYWSTGALAFSDEVKTEMGLGAKDMFLGFFYLGVPNEGLTFNVTRKPLDERVEWVE